MLATVSSDQISGFFCFFVFFSGFFVFLCFFGFFVFFAGPFSDPFFPNGRFGSDFSDRGPGRKLIGSVIFGFSGLFLAF